MQPTRNQKAIARIRITEIRREPLQSITPEDARAEGVPGDAHFCIAQYATLWDGINKRKGSRWVDNPMVWVLSFGLVKLKSSIGE